MSTKRGAVTPNAQYGIHKFGYILGKTLGSGAYAKVKTATSLKSNTCKGEVAVKIIDKKSAPKDVVAKFLPREIETLKELDHENIIKLYDVIDTTETMYLVLELATSGDLLDFINSRRYLSERMARTLFTDLVTGIKVCHNRNIVHRDLKCENLLLDAHLKLKISDFGFARKTDGQNLETYCGSYAYAAPEVILGQPYIGQAADVWSMGVILFAMLAGKLPFKDSDVRTLLAEISSVLVYPSRLGDEVKHLISRMLTFAPHERITVQEIQDHHWMNVTTSQMVKDSKKPSPPAKDAKTNGAPTKEQKQGSPGKTEPPKTTAAPAKDTRPKQEQGAPSGKEPAVKTGGTTQTSEPKNTTLAPPKSPNGASASPPKVAPPKSPRGSSVSPPKKAVPAPPPKAAAAPQD